MKRTFTVCRTEDYEYETLYTPEEIAAARYIVFIDNGDDHLCATLKDVLDLIDGELFLAGFSDEVLPG